MAVSSWTSNMAANWQLMCSYRMRKVTFHQVKSYFKMSICCSWSDGSYQSPACVHSQSGQRSSTGYVVNLQSPLPQDRPAFGSYTEQLTLLTCFFKCCCSCSLQSLLPAVCKVSTVHPPAWTWGFTSIWQHDGWMYSSTFYHNVAKISWGNHGSLLNLYTFKILLGERQNMLALQHRIEKQHLNVCLNNITDRYEPYHLGKQRPIRASVHT